MDGGLYLSSVSANPVHWWQQWGLGVRSPWTTWNDHSHWSSIGGTPWQIAGRREFRKDCPIQPYIDLLETLRPNDDLLEVNLRGPSSNYLDLDFAEMWNFLYSKPAISHRLWEEVPWRMMFTLQPNSTQLTPLIKCWMPCEQGSNMPSEAWVCLAGTCRELHTTLQEHGSKINRLVDLAYGDVIYGQIVQHGPGT